MLAGIVDDVTGPDRLVVGLRFDSLTSPLLCTLISSVSFFAGFSNTFSATLGSTFSMSLGVSFGVSLGI